MKQRILVVEAASLSNESTLLRLSKLTEKNPKYVYQDSRGCVIVVDSRRLPFNFADIGLIE